MKKPKKFKKIKKIKKIKGELRVGNIAYFLSDGQERDENGFYKIHFSNELTEYFIEEQVVLNIQTFDNGQVLYEFTDKTSYEYIDETKLPQSVYKMYADSSNVFKTKQDAINRLVELNHKMVTKLYERHIQVQKFKATHK